MPQKSRNISEPGLLWESSITRREFLKKSATGAGAVATTMIVGGCGTSWLGTGAISAKLMWDSAAKSALKRVASAPAEVATVRVIVSGPGISNPLQQDFAASAGGGVIDGVPVGSDRVLTAQGLSPSGVVMYQGVATHITIQAGVTTDAGIIIMSLVALGAFNGTIVLGAPTATSIAANVFSSSQSGTLTFTCGTAPGRYDSKAAPYLLEAGKALLLSLNGLSPDTSYYYRLDYLANDGVGSGPTQECFFHTARTAGKTFTFTIQADSHLDENSDPVLYLQTLSNILTDRPDFHIDLGDTFMCEKHSEPLSATVLMAANQATVDARYRYELTNFGTISHSVPLFLVNGNHEGEAGWLTDGSANNIAIWTTQARQKYYSNPVPDGFYSGDTTEEKYVGKRASWYSWQWGDALFVVLDPFWNSMVQSSKDPWGMTLGDRQYRWLQDTLAASQAQFKFIFIHNLVGGLDGQMRGGIEAAPFFEWGGRNPDGTDVFSLKRPGWSMPVHQLLVQYNVTAVFHGHDHLYDKQIFDGIIYQEVPQPSAKNSTSGQSLATQYHYLAGTILSSSGHLRVTVSPDGVAVQYVRAWLPASETGTRKNGQVDDIWSISMLGTFSGTIVLGAPTDTSVKANVFSPAQSGSAYISYGTSSGVYNRQTATKAVSAGTPLEFAMDGLASDTQYYYRLHFNNSAGSGSGPTPEYSFHTARPAGGAFTFCIQGDSHPERLNSQFNPDLYARTLLTAAADKPDFYLAIGDDFSIDQLDPATITAAQVTERYTLQRPYLGLIGHSSPVFLVNGNHEQAARYLLDGTPDNVAVWAQNARNQHFSQPVPDGFYNGNTEQIPHIGLLRNYYAWTWGDALFVVIDPYWASPVCVDNPFYGGVKRSNLWDITHGDAQYQWFKTTLEQNRSKFKFVFAHHVMGTGRGGIELAGKYEWGGQNSDGSWGLTKNRPTWPSSIHQLMVDNKVTIFFQGHDHIWARQLLDGVTYQTLPEPADPNYTLYNSDAYLSGDKMSNTGYTKVTVSPTEVKVEYVRTWLPQDEGPGKISGTTAFRYSLS